MQDQIIRVHTWDEYIGQAKAKHRLSTHINAAISENRMLEHTLFHGAAGFGKTTLARIVAAQLQDELKEFVAPIKSKVLERELLGWEDGGILFLDEIHRFSKAEQEDLLSLLSDGFLQSASGRKIFVPPLTIIGATTEKDKIITPLLDRFILQIKLVDYDDDEMAQVVSGMVGRLDLDLDPEMCMKLGKATGGVPRNGERFAFAGRALRANDQAVEFQAILDLTGMDADGISEEQVEYLSTLADLGGEAGIEILSAMLQVNTRVLKDMERLLLKRGFLAYGPKGRELTNDGFNKVRGNVTQPGTRRRESHGSRTADQGPVPAAL